MHHVLHITNKYPDMDIIPLYFNPAIPTTVSQSKLLFVITAYRKYMKGLSFIEISKYGGYKRPTAPPAQQLDELSSGKRRHHSA